MTSSSVTSKISGPSARSEPSGIVAKMMGTAPRRPAHEAKATHCQGIGAVRVVRLTHPGRRKAPNEATTLSGRATTSRSAPARSATPTASPSRLGKASRPSMTNSPIWTVQANPSMKPSTERRCGSGDAARIRATTYTAANPDVCSTAASP